MKNIVLFIGGGNMASALIGGMMTQAWQAEQIVVLEPSASQRARLSSSRGVIAIGSHGELPREIAIVVWAVKPQVLHEAIAPLAHALTSALHISIAAGVRTDFLVNWLGTKRLVRAMPNTSAVVGCSVTGVYASANISQADKDATSDVLGSIGTLVCVDSDDRMDAVTAVIGSGPAYVLHFLEGFQRAAGSLGFDESQAREMALQVAKGAVQQALESHDELAYLRNRVTSPEGTTAAALQVLDRRQTKEALGDAVNAACRRAIEMGAAFKCDS